MADSVPVGKAFIDVMPNLTGFGAAGAAAGTQASAGFGSTFGSGMKKVGKAAAAGFAALAGGTALAGAGLVKLGGDFDEAYDTIQTGTGATGDKLDGLNDSFRNVFSSIPTSMGDASGAITELNTITGATGDELENLSTGVLEASRLLGEDGASNAQTFGRALKQWGVEADEGRDQLDGLFKITQDYGVGLGGVSKQLTEYGAVLKNAGFSMEESAVLFGQLEKSGLSVSRVMPGLNMAFRSWAEEGKNSRKELNRTVKAMQGAETDTEALKIATEEFGAEGAQRMTTAVRSGNLELGDLQKALKGADGSISDTAGETDSWGEKLRTLGNKVLVGLEPLATKVFEGFGTAIEKATPYIETFASWLGENLPKAMDSVGDAFGWVQDNVIPPLVSAFESVVAWFKDNWPQIKDILLDAWEAYQTYWTTVVAPLANSAIDVFRRVVAWFRENWPQIKATISDLITWLQEVAWPIIQRVGQFIADEFQKVVAWFRENWPQIKATISDLITWLQEVAWPIIQRVGQFIADEFGKVVAWFKENWPEIRETVDNVIGAVKRIIETTIGTVKRIIETTIKVIQKIWEVWGDEILAIAENIWNTVKGVIDGVIRTVRGIINTVTSLIKGDWEGVWNGIQDIVGGVWDTIKAIVEGAINHAKEVLSGVLDTIQEIWNGAWDAVKSTADDIWEGIKGAVEDGVEGVVGWFQDLPGRLLEGAKDLLSAGQDLAGDLLGGLADGLGAVWDTVTSPFRDAINEVIGWFNNLRIPEFNFGGQDMPGFLPDLPSFTVGGWDMFNIPTLHTGGIVPGTGDVPAMLEGGEGVFTRDQMAALGANLANPGQQSITIDVQNGTDELVRVLQGWFRTNEGGHIAVRSA